MNFKDFKSWHASRLAGSSSPFRQPYPEKINPNADSMAKMMRQWIANWSGQEIKCAGYENSAAGEHGYVFWFNSKENALLVADNALLVATPVDDRILEESYTDPDLFEGAFARHMSAEKMVKGCDDNSRGLTGFVVYDCEGITWHHIAAELYANHAATSII